MAAIHIVVGAVLIGLVLWDIFHTMVLPRTFASNLRLAHTYYRISWPLVRGVACRMSRTRLRDSLLASFGPLSLLGLIFCWALVLVLGFGLLFYGTDPGRSFAQLVYLSGTTFFTLGIGDEHPLNRAQRVLTITEAGIGFATLAIVIGYLPVLYQSFARREFEIVMLDSRAGQPSTAAGILTRFGRYPNESRMLATLEGYERWCAEMMENHSSYPVLAYYRSQHQNQSWLAALTTLMDACAVLQVGFENHPEWSGSVEDQAELTFSMGLRAIVRLNTLIAPNRSEPLPNRLPISSLVQLRRVLSRSGLELRWDEDSRGRLIELRQLYETQVAAIGQHLLLDLPPFIVEERDFESTTPEVAVKEESE